MDYLQGMSLGSILNALSLIMLIHLSAEIISINIIRPQFLPGNECVSVVIYETTKHLLHTTLWRMPFALGNL